jgi:GntR family transcriptional regulator, transcriptional repressor for pyruvate dehydrogenase complex
MLQIEKIRRPEPPSAEVSRRIIDFLLASDYEPGSRLPSERQLAAALGVGRSAVRDALRPLVWLGILEVRQGDGTYLRSLSSDVLPRVVEWGLLLGDDRALDLVEARQAIESATARLAAERRTASDIADLEAAVRRMEAAIGDPTGWSEATIDLHVLIASIARNSVLLGVLTNVNSLLRKFIEEASRSEMGLGRAFEIHEVIVNAIAAGDGEAAVDAMNEDLEMARERLVDALEARGASRLSSADRPEHMNSNLEVTAALETR